MRTSLRTYLLFIVEILGLIFLIQGNFLWPIFLLVSFFLIILVIIKERSKNNTRLGLLFSLLAGVAYSVFAGGGLFALLGWHLGLVVVYSMIKRYTHNSLHVGPLTLTVRASSWMTLSFVLSVLTFLTLHFSLEDIECDDITTIVQQYSPTIDQWVGNNNSILPVITLSDQAPIWQNNINIYLTQIQQTRKQKSTLDDQVCLLFVDAIHRFGQQAGVQLGSLGLLFALIYTISYLPLLVLTYLFAGILYLFIALGVVKRKETPTRKRRLN